MMLGQQLGQVECLTDCWNVHDTSILRPSESFFVLLGEYVRHDGGGGGRGIQ